MDSSSKLASPKITPLHAAGNHPAAHVQAAIVDHTGAADRLLLVFGWILGLAHDVVRADIAYGNLAIDVRQAGHLIKRSDGAMNLPISQGNFDHHGFYLLIDLKDVRVRTSYLRLNVVRSSGESVGTVWPVSCEPKSLAAFLNHNRETLDWLLGSLSAQDQVRLRSALPPPAATASPIAAPASRALGLILDCCGLVGPDLLVIFGRTELQGRRVTSATMIVGERSIELRDHLAMGENSSPGGLAAGPMAALGGEARFSIVVPLRTASAVPSEISIEMADAAGRRRARCTLQTDRDAARTEVLAKLHALDDTTAVWTLERLCAVPANGADPSGATGWLRMVCEAVTQRFSDAVMDEGTGVFLHCDKVIRVPDHGVFLQGWFAGPPHSVASATVHMGHRRVRIDQDWSRQAREDVSPHIQTLASTPDSRNPGFSCVVAHEPEETPYLLSVTLRGGEVHFIRLPQARWMAPMETIRAILSSFEPTHPDLPGLLDRQIGPAVQRVWASRGSPKRPVTCRRLGPVPQRPAVSVIVPLFGRADLAEYQLALFADDPDFQAAELIYFVDDPSLYDDFNSRSPGLYELYRVPFLVAYAGANLGFAGANNAAASIASGDHLLLLNSDVLPKYSGWLGEMLREYQTLERPGCLGVKLLYEDGSLQHAGMAFRRYPAWGNLWINDHPHKGHHVEDLRGVQEVPAATAACLLVEAQLYREAGGLSEDFIIGDFEDSDFCLRLKQRGRRNWVLLDTELYHLERQSQARIGDARWRANLTLFNCWQHSQRWGATIENLRP
jgi:GT2 family glycosyltransferase